jgi:uncharacterized protein (TIGR00369 family)
MAAGVAASNFAEERRAGRTLQASIYYLRPGKGAYLRAVGRRIKSGRTTGLAEVEVFDEDDRMVAKANSRYTTSDAGPRRNPGRQRFA